MTVAADAQQRRLPPELSHPLWGGFLLVGLFAAMVTGWALYAPLATSVQAAGHLVTLRPSFEIQHPYGGRIAAVFVREHQSVEKGDLLVQMDSVPEAAQLVELRAQIDAIVRENTAAQSFFQDPQSAGLSADSVVEKQFSAMHRAVVLEAEAARAQASALRRQADILGARIAAGQEQRASMRERYERQLRLVEKGSFRAVEQDALFESLMGLEGEISSDAAEIVALGSQAAQAAMRAAGAEAKFRSQLLTVLADNEKRLPELRRQQIDLNNRIQAAELRAPAPGVVSGLSFSTRQMFAPRGETLMVLSGQSSTYHAAFTVPPSLIDQMDAGMVGALMLTGLPQRNLPRVRAVVRSLSPSARRNAEGTPVGYDGLAELNATDVDALRAAAPEGMRFSADMPLTLTFPGREITFVDYLISPFFGFLGKALQD